MTPLLVDVRNLSVTFFSSKREIVAVKGISFALKRNETLTIIGESGSGKTVTCRAILNLNRGAEVSGEILFEKRNILKLSEKDLQEIRGRKIAMIFQSPNSALNPAVKIGDQIAEVVRFHKGWNKKDALDQAIIIMEKVGIADAERKVREYPYQQSVGINQRILIAIALSCEPSLLIADEPTSSLDVVTQKQIMDLFHEIKREQKIGIIFVTHNLALTSGFADRIIIMRHGTVVETGDAETIFHHPSHEYTRMLVAAIPTLE